MGAHEDQRGPLRLRARSAQRPVDRVEVVAVADRLGMPAVRRETASAILGERDVGAGGKRHVVVVVQIDELAESEMACQRGSLGGDTLHEVAIADDSVGKVIDDVEAGAVVARRQLRFGHRHSHAVAEALTERARRHLDSRCYAALGMTRRDAAPLAKPLDLLE